MEIFSNFIVCLSGLSLKPRSDQLPQHRFLCVQVSSGDLVSSAQSPEVQSLEAKVGQLQSRLAYMEDEKARLVTAAKSKNEQVQQIGI